MRKYLSHVNGKYERGADKMSYSRNKFTVKDNKGLQFFCKMIYKIHERALSLHK